MEIFAILPYKIAKISDFQLWAQVTQKLQVVQRPTIRHFLAMVVDNKILEEQGRGSIKDLPRPFFLKSTLFTNGGRGKPLITPRPSLSGIFMYIIRAFKWGIICFFTIIGSHLIWRKPKLMFKVVHINPSPLYVSEKKWILWRQSRIEFTLVITSFQG